MAQVCSPAGCVDAVRLALVDECTDAPVAGAANGYVVNCVRNVEWTTNVEEGDETVLETDCGKKCWITKQCDEVRNYTFTMQLLNPDYQLQSLISGDSAALINVGGEDIGIRQRDGFPCAPWLSVELFEKVPDEDCTPDHLYRRIVLPKVRFSPWNNEKEAPFRVVTLTATTSPAQLNAWGDGPYNDSPFDFAALAASEKSHHFEYFDDGITEPLVGTCGFIAVPAELP